MDQQTCISCGIPGEGQFCSNCGERIVPKKINWKHLIQDGWNNLIALDGPFLKTCKALTTRPGQFGREYVEGKRKSFVKPTQFFILAVALHSLSVIYLVDLKEMMQVQTPYGSMYNEAQLEIYAKLQQAGEQWGKSLQFATLPFLAFFTWLFFRRRSKMNFLENTVLFMYTTGFLLIVNIFMTQLMRVLPYLAASLFSMLTFFGVLMYHGWAISKFHGQKGAGNFIRGMVAVCIGMLLFSSLVGISAVLLYWNEVKEFFVYPVPK